MKLHGKKMIAPIVVTVILVLYYVAYFGILIALLEGIWKVVLGIGSHCLWYSCKVCVKTNN